MSKLLKRKVQVVSYQAIGNPKVKVGMVGEIDQVTPYHNYPIRVQFTGTRELFAAKELRYLNGKEVVIDGHSSDT